MSQICGMGIFNISFVVKNCIFKHIKDEVGLKYRTLGLRNKKIHNLFLSPRIIRYIKAYQFNLILKL